MLKGYHELRLSDNTVIPMRFCTWTFNRFAVLNGNLSFSALIELLGSGEISGSQITSLLLCGAEYVCKKENKPFHYSDLDASEWIDDMGGLLSPKLQEVIVAAMQALSPVQDSPAEPQEATEKNAPASR